MSDGKVNPVLPPPSLSVGVIGWIKKNLFPSWYSGVLTVVLGYFIISSLIPFIDWAILKADFIGESPADCTSEGACWVFIGTRLDFFIYGFYPESEHWRVNVIYLIFGLIIVPQFFSAVSARIKMILGVFGVTVFPALSFVMIYGSETFGLPIVGTSVWGGLTLTLILAYVGIVAAIPIGILLALGRRSDMPLVRALCVVFIEFWRGVPLITILFMASVMLPLFLPDGVTFDRLLRALIGITLFQSAYMAEVIRGGLQAIPKGQYEAAEALGLGYWQGMGLIILPQALKIVIPGIVNTLISLFKDTTLVLVIGLFDLLRAVQATIIDPAWRNVATEGYIFAAFVFWVFCYSMSRYSQMLERKLHTGHKR
ncbi:MAG TPA: amino acid ABC transporter permease [Azoarcus taiwanensis]|nr:amino acid ABC transporter permease [Azoarcus taiwanensis]